MAVIHGESFSESFLYICIYPRSALKMKNEFGTILNFYKKIAIKDIFYASQVFLGRRLPYEMF